MTKRPAEERHVPDLVLERYRLGELPAGETEALEARLDADAELRARLAALDRSDEEIHRLYPPAWLARRIRSRAAATPSDAGRRSNPRAVRWTLPVGFAAAAAVALALLPRLLGPPPIQAPGARPPSSETSGEPGVRVKGLEPSLALFRRTDAGSETLADGSVARAGDVLRVGYRAAGRSRGVILSVDGRGVVTIHLPARGSEAALLQGAETVLLDRAYELDDAPRFERFYFVTADREFDVGPIVDAVRRAGEPGRAGEPPPLSLPPSFRQSVLTIQKGTQP